jgi:hypothetical protein
LTGTCRFDLGSDAIWTAQSRSDGGRPRTAWRRRTGDWKPTGERRRTGNSSVLTRSTARRHGFQRDLHRSEACDARGQSKALGWACRRRWRQAARWGRRQPTADGGERARREAGHGNTNERHRGAPHRHVVLPRVFLATERRRTAAPDRRRC